MPTAEPVLNPLCDPVSVGLELDDEVCEDTVAEAVAIEAVAVEAVEAVAAEAVVEAIVDDGEELGVSQHGLHI